MQQFGSQKVTRATGEQYQCTGEVYALGNVSERSCLQKDKQYPVKNICFASSKLSVGKMRLEVAYNFHILCKHVYSYHSLITVSFSVFRKRLAADPSHGTKVLSTCFCAKLSHQEMYSCKIFVFLFILYLVD